MSRSHQRQPLTAVGVSQVFLTIPHSLLEHTFKDNRPLLTYRATNLYCVSPVLISSLQNHVPQQIMLLTRGQKGTSRPDKVTEECI